MRRYAEISQKILVNSEKVHVVPPYLVNHQNKKFQKILATKPGPPGWDETVFGTIFGALSGADIKAISHGRFLAESSLEGLGRHGRWGW